MITRDFIRKNHKKYKDREELVAEVMRKCLCPRKTVINYIAELGLAKRFPQMLSGGRQKKEGLQEGKSDTQESKTSSVKPKRLSSSKFKGIDGLRKLFDKTQRIQEFIETELKERQWILDSELRERLRISVSQWRHYAGQFSEYQRKPEGVLIWIHPDYMDEADEFL